MVCAVAGSQASQLSQPGAGGKYFAALRLRLTRCDRPSENLRHARRLHPSEAITPATVVDRRFSSSDSTGHEPVISSSFEAFESKLGVLDMGAPDAVRPVAIWGRRLWRRPRASWVPASAPSTASSSFEAFESKLGMVSASHNPLAGYLDRVRDAAC
jgi:hypothetical protein